MKRFRYLALAAVAGVFIVATAPKIEAQVSVGVNIGAAPACPYGYYDSAPYACAPYGYYGTEWFTGGAFIGAGSWFNGPENFRGHGHNRFLPEHGYRGQMAKPGDSVAHFKGNEVRDGRGHVGGQKR